MSHLLVRDGFEFEVKQYCYRKDLFAIIIQTLPCFLRAGWSGTIWKDSVGCIHCTVYNSTWQLSDGFTVIWQTYTDKYINNMWEPKVDLTMPCQFPRTDLVFPTSTWSISQFTLMVIHKIKCHIFYWTFNTFLANTLKILGWKDRWYMFI